MRDSNYTFPMQNRVCVSITAQLYDRRALDTSASLPLLNSLTHLTYLSSTSPRIREILTVDGGLERLLEILQESSLPRPPSPPSDWYSLRGPSTASILTQSQQNSLRHSLAFQCIVNIGVRGSEAIRTRVVESGALDVVAQIMEVWLKGKGMSIVSGPLGSQAAVDRAAREGIIPGQHRSRDRRHRTDEEREKDRERKARQEAKQASAEVEAVSAPAAPVNPSNGHAESSAVDARQQPEANGSTYAAIAQPSAVTSGISASRPPRRLTAPGPGSLILTREALETSLLLPIDDPSPEQAARMTLEQRATIVRINAVARLAGLDRNVLRRSLAEDSLNSERLREYFRSFGLDVSALDVLRTPPTSPLRIPISRLAADHHARERRRDQRSLAGPGALEEDITMEVDEAANSAAEPDGTPSRRGTITASTAIAPLASQLEAMTPRAPSAPLPVNADYLNPFSPEQTNAMLQPRLIRAETMEEMAILDEGNQVMGSESPLAQSASSSTSALSLMGEDGALSSGPELFAQAESSSSAQARAGNIFEARSALLSTAPAIDMSNISNTSTPVGTPPVASAVGHRDRSRTITNAQHGPATQADDRQADSEDPTRAPSRSGEADRPNSRAGTEDDESADGDQMGDAMDVQIGIVGSADDDDGMAALDTMQRGIGGDDMATIGGVDVNAQAQAEVDLAMGAPPGAPGAAQTPRIPEMTPRQTLRLTLPPNNAQDRRDFAGGPAVVIAAGAPRSFSDLSNLVNVLETTSTTNESTYSDDTILLCLQLLAYLSKYPHVRAAFHHPRRPMHPDVQIPADVPLPDQPFVSESTNMFSLVERFTFRPSPPDPDLVKLPTDIQYWAGVIMRNACRKDELHGGVRQCANMSCGRLETFPREFAKCRRCRKAKYCSKECQSKGWQEGHRFWCNARDAEPDNPITGTVIIPSIGAHAAAAAAQVGFNVDPALEAARRRHQRLRDRSQETQGDVDLRRRTDVTPAPIISRVQDRRQRSTDPDAMDVDTDAPPPVPAARRLSTVGEAIPPTPVIPHTRIRQQPGIAHTSQTTWQ